MRDAQDVTILFDHLKPVRQNDVWIHCSNVKMIYEREVFTYWLISQFLQLHIEGQKQTQVCRSHDTVIAKQFIMIVSLKFEKI